MRGRKAFSLFVLVAFLLSLAIPAFAASAMPKLAPQPKVFRGAVVSFDSGESNYALVPKSGKYYATMKYVLVGPVNFSKYVGRDVAVVGYASGASKSGWPVIKAVCVVPLNPIRPLR